jgi:cystathionine gamma-synthase
VRPATHAARAGRPDAPGAGVNPPIELSATYRAGGDRIYGREDNPTWEAFEEALGALEGGPALAFSSGMAAISAVFETLPIGTVVAVANAAYNGTRRWCADAAARGRLTVRLVDVTDSSAAVAACGGAALIWLESPTNPSLDIADLRTIASGAHDRGALVAVDNTLATPMLQRPLALGADLVVHSVTKWLGGHSDLLMGAVVAASDNTFEALKERRSLSGGVAVPFEAWLALRGLRTLPARLERASTTAAELASRLQRHAAVDRVRYPGLVDHPGHALAARQMDGFGAMVSFEVAGGADAADGVCTRLKLLTPATSLGGVETLIERRAKYQGEDATPAGLLRMSVGQEDVEDLWEDLDCALSG